MATDAVKVRQAAERLREKFEEAREGGYYGNGWYAYMAKWDVELLVEFALRETDIGEGVYLDGPNR